MSFIRTAKPGDAVRLSEIEIADYRLFFYPIFRTDRYFFSEMNVPALVNEYREMPEKIDRSFVYDDGVVKGFIRVNGSEIEKLFVEPAFQGQGIGGALIEHAVKETAGRRLLVLEKNLNAIRFYERHGFKATEERQRVDNTEELFVVMKR